MKKILFLLGVCVLIAGCNSKKTSDKAVVKDSVVTKTFGSESEEVMMRVVGENFSPNAVGLLPITKKEIVGSDDSMFVAKLKIANPNGGLATNYWFVRVNYGDHVRHALSEVDYFQVTGQVEGIAQANGKDTGNTFLTGAKAYCLAYGEGE